MFLDLWSSVFVSRIIQENPEVSYEIFTVQGTQEVIYKATNKLLILKEHLVDGVFNAVAAPPMTINYFTHNGKYFITWHLDLR